MAQYFVSSVPVEVMTEIARDWHEELREYPSWALQKACRWWMSAENDKRRHKPIAGDIAARAKIEMGVVKVAELALRRFSPSEQKPAPESRPMPSEAQRAKADEYVRNAGIRLRKDVAKGVSA